MKNPLVSVIIPTKNEQLAIGRCIESVKKQTYRHIECIVVDNNSTDKTLSIAKKYGVNTFTKGPERSTQRNFGAGIAKGTYLFFVDADMVLTPKVVEECVVLLQKDNKKAVIIPEKSFGSGFWAECKELERSFYVGVLWMEAPRFIEKQVFKSLGGFNETLTAFEDFDFSQKIQERFSEFSITHAKSFIFHDEGDLSFWQLLRKKYYYGMSIEAYRKQYEKSGVFKKQINIFTRYCLFLRHPGKIFRSPVISFGMFFMKLCEMTALGLGYIKGIFFSIHTLSL
jgi:glycosyltransferase involved in cell wall biosynthesis